MNIWNKFSTLIVLGLFSTVGIAFADFESDTTPVDMRDYWPSDQYKILTYRRSDGSIYRKTIIKPYPYDPMLYWESPAQPGEDHFSREDYYPDFNNPTEATYFSNSWSMVKKPDKSVWEIADSSAPGFPNCSYQADWCTGPGYVYKDRAIVHGRPGGHTLNEDYYYQCDVPVFCTPNLQTTEPSLLAGTYLYSVTRLEKKYNTFTPWYGRGKDGSWGAGKAKTYNNVVLMVFQHGIKNSNTPDRVCPNAPSWFYHFPGYKSYVDYEWYAPGVGPIQELLIFDEGVVTNDPTGNGVGFVVSGPSVQPYCVWYIDTYGSRD